MGRGRQKAKAQRQARDIKYYSPATDLSALERELAKHDSFPSHVAEQPEESYDDYSDYDDLAKKYGDDDDESEGRH